MGTTGPSRGLRLGLALREPEATAQALRAVPLLCLALWMLAPWWDMFADGTAWHHLLDLAPRGVWVSVAAAIALLHVWAVLTAHWAARRAALLLSILWWTVLIWLFLMYGEAWRGSMPLMLGYLVPAFVFYARLGKRGR